MHRITFVLFLCTIFASGSFSAETRDLILVAGQSNAVGADTSSVEIPANSADKDILFWWRCGDPPPDDHDSTSKDWTTLQPQQKGNPMAKNGGVPRQFGNFNNPKGGFGPEMGFARALYAREKKRLAIVKVAFNGTGMTTDWDHGNPGAGGACYRALVEETKKAVTKAAEKGITLRVRAMVWVQGESDARERLAPEYEKNLGEMIKALRKELNAPDMIVLVGVNTNFGGGKNKFMPVIVEQQKSLAAHLARCAYVDTSGLTYANAAHFDTKSTLTVGERFAEALLKMSIQPASG